MPLPPIKISDEVQKAAYDDLAKGPMRKFGDALTVIADRIANPRFKSIEERALDWQIGAEESENRRRLAAEALDLLPPERRVFPARQIVGPIFRDSEFELPDTPLWTLWTRLLRRACDRDRIGEAHPAFPSLIKVLALDEVLILQKLMEIRREGSDPGAALGNVFAEDLGLVFPKYITAYNAHLEGLGLCVVSGFPLYLGVKGKAMTISHVPISELTPFGAAFAAAVIEPDRLEA